MVSLVKTSKITRKKVSCLEKEQWVNRGYGRQEEQRQQEAADIERMIIAKVEQALRLLR